MSEKFYITTPIFYPNANLHLGHAYTVTVCDIVARYHRLVGDSTYFLTGSDENTGKILKTIKENNREVSEYLEEATLAYKKLYTSLNISYDQFIRTGDKDHHWPGAIALWNKLVDAGDLYKSTYYGLYCVGCETFYTEKDLVNGVCPIHLTVPEKVEEENYFFKLSKYTTSIKEKIENNEIRIIPETRRNEILAQLERGLEDVSFSRPLEKVPHGIPVPGDSSQVIYVWCDALVNYISALGFGREDDHLYTQFWPANVHVIGKDILRFHSALWPAMLLSAGLPLPKAILAHGLLISNGHKMSKSLGNTIDPYEIIDMYGYESIRYYFARHVSLFEDGDVTTDKLKESYNAHLANGIGNLTSRIMKMAQDNLSEPVNMSSVAIPHAFVEYMNAFEINKACDYIWDEIGMMDQYIQENQPFKVIKTDVERGHEMITNLVVRLYTVAYLLNPILPGTSEKIKKLIQENKTPQEPLFLRKD